MVIDQAALDEVFQNNPLKQVAFEIRFPFNLRVQRDFCEVQNQIKKEYPKFFVEDLEAIEGSLARLHSFRSADDTRSIRVSEDRFTVLFTRYKDFEVFKSEALVRTEAFCRHFSITHCLRVGLRYVNHIEVPREGGFYQITKAVNPYFDVKRATASGPMKFSLEIVMKKPPCLLALRTAFRSKLPEQPTAIYLLDLDAFLQEETPVEDLGKLLPELHHQVQLEFLSHITEEYKLVMRGDAK